MTDNSKSLETAEDLLGFLDEAPLPPTRLRDLKSALKRNLRDGWPICRGAFA